MTVRERLALFILGAGFLLTGLEVRYLHREMLPFAWQPWIPIVVSALACLACWGTAWKSTERTLAAVAVFTIGLASGLYGLWLHSDGELGRISHLMDAPDRKSGEDDDEDHREPEPPLLAPLSLTGLSSIGIVLTARRKRDTSEEAEDRIDAV